VLTGFTRKTFAQTDLHNTAITCEGDGPSATTSSGSLLCWAARYLGLNAPYAKEVEALRIEACLNPDCEVISLPESSD
jgi:hypothetical protein